jgi:hypothetical protein
MSTIGTVKSSSIGKAFRTKLDAVILKVTIDDDRDVQTVQYLFASGENSIPVSGTTVLIHEISPEYKVATASNTGVVVTLNEGEKAIYAIKDGVFASIIELLVNGEVVINKGSGYAVEFEALEIAFNELKEDYNKLVSTITTTWVPVPNDGGAALKAAVNADNPTSNADVGDAKVEKVRI